MTDEMNFTPSINADVFDAFLATYGGVRCTKMLGSTASAHMLIDLVFATARRKLPELHRGRKYQSRDLCADAWPLLAYRQRMCAGMCMVFLAREGLLPIVLHQTKSGRGAKKYWLVLDGVPLAAAST